MAELSVQKSNLNGVAPSFVAASAGGDTFENDGRIVLWVKNGGASSINVTFDSQQQCNQGYDHDMTISVPAGGERVVGPFPAARWNDAQGKVHVSYSAVTSVTVAAVGI